MKLEYFDARGVVEKTRYMLALAKADYADARYPVSFGTPGDFSTIQRPEFDAAKATGALDAGLGKVPILHVGTVKLAQSKAIERYVAKRFGFMGQTDLDAALIDAACEHERDAKDQYQKVRATPEADKPAAMTNFFDATLPDLLGKIDKAMPDADGPWLFGGDGPSLADVVFYVFLREFFDNKDGVAAALAKAGSSKILKSIDAFAALPDVQAWQTKRPQTPL